MNRRGFFGVVAALLVAPALLKSRWKPWRRMTTKFVRTDLVRPRYEFNAEGLIETGMAGSFEYDPKIGLVGDWKQVLPWPDAPPGFRCIVRETRLRENGTLIWSAKYLQCRPS